VQALLPNDASRQLWPIQLTVEDLLHSNPTFTYRMDGPVATFLGRGDHHETKFDNMKVTSMLKDLDSFSISERQVYHVSRTSLKMIDK
jgi:hypothetical protein